jgi:hypothetical protein
LLLLLLLMMITVSLLSCMKLFTLYSSCVNITIVFPFPAFVMVSLFVDTLFFYVCY